MDILVVWDNGVKEEHFRLGLKRLDGKHTIRTLELDRESSFVPSTESEKRIANRHKESVGSPKQIKQQIGDSDILVVNYAPITAEVMDVDENLKLIGVTRSGPVNVDTKAAIERGISVVYTPDPIIESVAEFTIGLLLAEVRKICLSCHTLKSGEEFKANRRLYPDANTRLGPGVTGKILGIVGLGNIGKSVALKARVFGMKILACDPYISKSTAGEVGAELVDLATLLAQADFVTLHVRLTPETRHMINEAHLALMKREAYLINTARGEVIDEEALYKVLKNRRIAGAALDVVEEEPIDLRNRLIRLDNVTITPHIAAVTEDAPIISASIIAEEINRFARGDKLTRIVPWQL